MFSTVWPAMPERVINTHEDADHIWGNQLFQGAEIIAHRNAPSDGPYATVWERHPHCMRALGGGLVTSSGSVGHCWCEVEKGYKGRNIVFPGSPRLARDHLLPA
jgi:glyoxylase-like metal-dependent hydrolase (beta-lactamase superfamily II)